MSDIEDEPIIESVEEPKTKTVTVHRRGRKQSTEVEIPLSKKDTIQAPREEEPPAVLTVKEKKKITNPKILEGLAKGRAIRDENRRIKKEAQDKLAEEWAMKKANNRIKQELKIKGAIVGDDDVDSDEDTKPVVAIQPKKAKKKRVVYLPPESDSEEEVVYKRIPAKKKPVEVPIELPPQRIFW